MMQICRKHNEHAVLTYIGFVRGFVQETVCSLFAYLASVAVLVVGVPQAFDNVAVSTVFFWND